MAAARLLMVLVVCLCCVLPLIAGYDVPEEGTRKDDVVSAGDGGSQISEDPELDGESVKANESPFDEAQLEEEREVPEYEFEGSREAVGDLERRGTSKDGDVEKLKTLVEKQQDQLKEHKSAITTLTQQVDALILQRSPVSKDRRNIVSARATSVSATLTTGGVNYVRWGRTACNGRSNVLYQGFVGGSGTSNKGGSNALCLHESPQWGTTSATGSNYIYGAEYKFTSTPFSLSNTGSRTSFMYHDAPCVVCHAAIKSNQIMIPGRRSCPVGWTYEYRGYLMSGYYSYAHTDYLCFDEAPEVSVAGSASQGGVYLYPVRGGCGSLPCPPYFSGRHITCVVCTK